MKIDSRIGRGHLEAALAGRRCRVKRGGLFKPRGAYFIAQRGVQQYLARLHLAVAVGIGVLGLDLEDVPTEDAAHRPADFARLHFEQHLFMRAQAGRLDHRPEIAAGIGIE